MFRSTMTDSDPLDLAGQAEREDAARASSLSAAATEESDIRWLMSGIKGRRIVWRLLDKSGVSRTSFTGEALSSAFNEGQRNFGQQLQTQVTEFCADEYIKMLEENRVNG